MVLSLVVVVLLVIVLLIQAGDASSVPTDCTTATDCGLLGTCKAGRCACYSGYIGRNCASLDVLPAPLDAGLRQKPNRSNWCGTILQDGDNSSLWHMYNSDFSEVRIAPVVLRSSACTATPQPLRLTPSPLRSVAWGSGPQDHVSSIRLLPAPSARIVQLERWQCRRRLTIRRRSSRLMAHSCSWTRTTGPTPAVQRALILPPVISTAQATRASAPQRCLLGSTAEKATSRTIPQPLLQAHGGRLPLRWNTLAGASTSHPPQRSTPTARCSLRSTATPQWATSFSSRRQATRGRSHV